MFNVGRSDFNTPQGTMGAGNFMATIDAKHESRGLIMLRCGFTHMPFVGSSLATAYLDDEVLRRPNLTVAVSVTTEKVIFSSDEGSNPRAIGVQVSMSKIGPRFVVAARKEVILSSGAIASPQLLMLSGIGPSEHLQKWAIPVVRHLPAVGRNLLDVSESKSTPTVVLLISYSRSTSRPAPCHSARSPA